MREFYGKDQGRFFLKKMALAYDSSFSRPKPRQPVLLPNPWRHPAPAPALWQEWLFWAPSWHDRLQTISGLKKGGGEGEDGGGNQEG